ncbi:MAG: antitoxin [Myxococcota bacterium]
MRTTLTLDADVHARLEEYARATRTSFKEAVNRVLRRGLVAEDAPSERFVVRTYPGGLAPGVDPARLNQLLDEMEADAFLARSR